MPALQEGSITTTLPPSRPSHNWLIASSHSTCQRSKQKKEGWGVGLEPVLPVTTEELWPKPHPTTEDDTGRATS